METYKKYLDEISESGDFWQKSGPITSYTWDQINNALMKTGMSNKVILKVLQNLKKGK